MMSQHLFVARNSLSKVVLSRHHREKHGDLATQAIFQCSFCPKSYALQRTLDAHTKDKHSEHIIDRNSGNFHCDECENESFKKVEDISQHYLIVS